ncbi:hypothetical protein [Staphylococcus simulans]|uniref:hypothetical protein n=1 Tax=Staphylococcus simulans TaxID=1286 RepID=UPI000D1F5D84|nr:hypothetical protein [Staphylococcus simulans]MDY5059699.1 hypothetical protein [Staphylococcus simulans]PTJ15875.1 hypothetical protein BU038_07665 [Staphylococcus simulans]RIN75652.1 hypothetical protein BU015_10435 [Staphylococcus simulans]
MNPRLKRAYQSYFEKFGEQPPKPYMSTLSEYEQEEIINQRLRTNTKFSDDKYYTKITVR